MNKTENNDKKRSISDAGIDDPQFQINRSNRRRQSDNNNNKENESQKVSPMSKSFNKPLYDNNNKENKNNNNIKQNRIENNNQGITNNDVAINKAIISNNNEKERGKSNNNDDSGSKKEKNEENDEDDDLENFKVKGTVKKIQPISCDFSVPLPANNPFLNNPDNNNNKEKEKKHLKESDGNETDSSSSSSSSYSNEEKDENKKKQIDKMSISGISSEEEVDNNNNNNNGNLRNVNLDKFGVNKEKSCDCNADRVEMKLNSMFERINNLEHKVKQNEDQIDSYLNENNTANTKIEENADMIINVEKNIKKINADIGQLDRNGQSLQSSLKKMKTGFEKRFNIKSQINNNNNSNQMDIDYDGDLDFGDQPQRNNRRKRRKHQHTSSKSPKSKQSTSRRQNDKTTISQRPRISNQSTAQRHNKVISKMHCVPIAPHSNAKLYEYNVEQSVLLRPTFKKLMKTFNGKKIRIAGAFKQKINKKESNTKKDGDYYRIHNGEVTQPFYRNGESTSFWAAPFKPMIKEIAENVVGTNYENIAGVELIAASLESGTRTANVVSQHFFGVNERIGLLLYLVTPTLYNLQGNDRKNVQINTGNEKGHLIKAEGDGVRFSAPAGGTAIGEDNKERIRGIGIYYFKTKNDENDNDDDDDDEDSDYNDGLDPKKQTNFNKNRNNKNKYKNSNNFKGGY